MVHASGALPDGHVSTKQWLIRGTGLSPTSASAELGRAAALRDGFATTRAAALAGELSQDKVRAITTGLTTAVTALHPAARAAALDATEAPLVDYARTATVEQVRRKITRLRFTLDPDGADARALAAHDEQHLRFTPVGDGVAIDGWLTKQSAATILTCLDQTVDAWYRTPTPTGTDTGAGMAAGSGDGANAGGGGRGPVADGPGAVRRRASRAHLNALALSELAALLLSGAALGHQAPAAPAPDRHRGPGRLRRRARRGPAPARLRRHPHRRGQHRPDPLRRRPHHRHHPHHHRRQSQHRLQDDGAGHATAARRPNRRREQRRAGPGRGLAARAEPRGASTSAAPNAPHLHDCAAPSSSATAAASPPAAPPTRRVARPTTSTSGATAAAPTSTTWPWSAPATTTSSTKAAGPWSAPPDTDPARPATGSSAHHHDPSPDRTTARAHHHHCLVEDLSRRGCRRGRWRAGRRRAVRCRRARPPARARAGAPMSAAAEASASTSVTRSGSASTVSIRRLGQLRGQHLEVALRREPAGLARLRRRG